MKIHHFLIVVALMTAASCANSTAGENKDQQQATTQNETTMQQQEQNNAMAKPVVYMTTDISPEGLVKVYEALGIAPQEGQRVAVKISTGESGGHHYLKPELIKNLVQKVDGTLVECNTAYGGSRQDVKKHWKTIEEHGFLNIAKVDIMDEFGDMQIPVEDTTYIKYDIVGEHLANYDFMINLAHFKGHAMGGFGGVLKNQSIGVASTAGKAYIHSCGITTDPEKCWRHTDNQDGFLESMASAAQGVHNYFKQEGRDIIYIDVMNNLSVDCDCDAHPAKPKMNDVGILASTDPVALDQACVDLVFNYPSTKGDDSADLIKRINRQHGIHILEHAAALGLGSREYELVNIDK